MSLATVPGGKVAVGPIPVVDRSNFRYACATGAGPFCNGDGGWFDPWTTSTGELPKLLDGVPDEM
jgi:hypothetical protein